MPVNGEPSYFRSQSLEETAGFQDGWMLDAIRDDMKRTIGACPSKE
jgi:hypothetical protein